MKAVLYQSVRFGKKREIYKACINLDFVPIVGMTFDVEGDSLTVGNVIYHMKGEGLIVSFEPYIVDDEDDYNDLVSILKESGWEMNQ